MFPNVLIYNPNDLSYWMVLPKLCFSYLWGQRSQSSQSKALQEFWMTISWLSAAWQKKGGRKRKPRKGYFATTFWMCGLPIKHSRPPFPCTPGNQNDGIAISFDRMFFVNVIWLLIQGQKIKNKKSQHGSCSKEENGEAVNCKMSTLPFPQLQRTSH